MRGAVNTVVLGFEMLKKKRVVRHLLADRQAGGWKTHTTLKLSWLLSLQSQTRLLSDLATGERVFLGSQQAKR